MPYELAQINVATASEDVFGELVPVLEFWAFERYLDKFTKKAFMPIKEAIADKLSYKNVNRFEKYNIKKSSSESA